MSDFPIGTMVLVRRKYVLTLRARDWNPECPAANRDSRTPLVVFVYGGARDLPPAPMLVLDEPQESKWARTIPSSFSETLVLHNGHVMWAENLTLETASVVCEIEP